MMPAIPAKSAAETSQDLKSMKEEVPFRAWPTRGIIPPHQFHLVVLEFVPTVAQNEHAFVASFPLVGHARKGTSSFIDFKSCELSAALLAKIGGMMWYATFVSPL